MGKPNYHLMTVTVIACFLLTSCTAKKIELTETGFLSGYSGLAPDEEFDGMRIYRNSTINIDKRYSKILIAPVRFELDPSVREEMDYDDRVKIADYFQEKLIEGLSANYEIVSEPGPDAMLFRAAITDVLPSKVYLNLHWSTSLLGGGIGGASLEAELVDSLTNERILAFLDAKKGKSAFQEPSHLISNYSDGLTKWGYTKQVLGNWAEIMVQNLDDLRAKYADEAGKDLVEVGSSQETKKF